MDPIGTTKEAIDILLEVIKFVRAYRDIPKDIENSLEQAHQSSENLKVWMDVFERIDQASIPEHFSANLILRLSNLKVALEAHGRQIRGWIETMGLRLTLGPHGLEDQGDKNRSDSTSIAKDNRVTRKFRDLRIPILRTMFILNGSQMLRNIEKKIKEAESDVSNVYLTIFPFVTFKAFPPDIDATRIPLVNFLNAAKKRQQEKVLVTVFTAEDWSKFYSRDETIVDQNIVHDFPTRVCSIFPSEEASSNKSKAAPELRGSFICYSRSDDADEEESMNLARLFQEDETCHSRVGQFSGIRASGDMLRLSAVIRTPRALQYIFRVPSGSSKVHTLRTLLLSGSKPTGGPAPVPLHPITERVKFSIRLATSVLVVHSLGLVHKRIQPESILVIDSDSEEASGFPYALGYPYLVGFHLSRSAEATTRYIVDFQALVNRGIYFHPREQEEKRTKKYSMISDIYSLGVCLFEIALWRSLFVVDPTKTEKSMDYVPDKSSAFEKLANDYYSKSMSMNQRAKEKTNELIRIAKSEIPKFMGDRFTDVVVACLRAGYPDSPFADDKSLKTEEEEAVKADTVSIKYLELVLKNLQAVYDGLASTR